MSVTIFTNFYWTYFLQKLNFLLIFFYKFILVSYRLWIIYIIVMCHYCVKHFYCPTIIFINIKFSKNFLLNNFFSSHVYNVFKIKYLFALVNYIFDKFYAIIFFIIEFFKILQLMYLPRLIDNKLISYFSCL